MLVNRGTHEHTIATVYINKLYNVVGITIAGLFKFGSYNFIKKKTLLRLDCDQHCSVEFSWTANLQHVIEKDNAMSNAITAATVEWERLFNPHPLNCWGRQKETVKKNNNWNQRRLVMRADSDSSIDVMCSLQSSTVRGCASWRQSLLCGRGRAVHKSIEIEWAS